MALCLPISLSPCHYPSCLYNPVSVSWSLFLPLSGVCFYFPDSIPTRSISMLYLPTYLSMSLTLCLCPLMSSYVFSVYFCLYIFILNLCLRVSVSTKINASLSLYPYLHIYYLYIHVCIVLVSPISVSICQDLPVSVFLSLSAVSVPCLCVPRLTSVRWGNNFSADTRCEMGRLPGSPTATSSKGGEGLENINMKTYFIWAN
jgi:hypothetical protein